MAVIFTVGFVVIRFLEIITLVSEPFGLTPPRSAATYVADRHAFRRRLSWAC